LVFTLLVLRLSLVSSIPCLPLLEPTMSTEHRPHPSPTHHHGKHFTVSMAHGSLKSKGSKAGLVKAVSMGAFSLAGVLARYGSSGIAASLVEAVPGGKSLVGLVGTYGIK
jgi:hypothetical protein